MRAAFEIMPVAIVLVLWTGASAARARADDAPGIPASQPASQPVMTRAGLIASAERIEREVADLRGWPFKQPVAKDVYSEEQLRQFILKALDHEYAGGKMERKQAMLWTVGLLPSGLDMRQTIIDVLLNQVGGFYDPESKSFCMLIRQGIPTIEFVNDILIAHELTHALDDQYLDLAHFTDPTNLTEDSQFAISAVVEGSATVEMQRYMLRRIGHGQDLGEDMQDYIAAEMRRADAFVSAPPYFSTLLANYLCGMTFLSQGDLTFVTDPGAGRKMQERMLRLVAHPPHSSEQILHPEKYWQQADDPQVVEEGPIEKLIETAGRHVVHRDTLGELLCGLLTSEPDRRLDMLLAATPEYWTTEAATGWGGDRFLLLADGPDESAARKQLKGVRGVWVTVWDTTADRDEFVDDYEIHRPDLPRRTVKVGDLAAVFLFGFEADETNRLAERLPEAVHFSRQPN